MRLVRWMFLLGLTTAAQNNWTAVVVNPATAAWTREAKDPPGSESVVVREDPKTGALDLLVRYPAGHVFAPHWHNANERIVMVEGRLVLRNEGGEKALEAGAFAFLPAKEVQRMSCEGKGRCTFYISWDGPLDFHRVK